MSSHRPFWTTQIYSLIGILAAIAGLLSIFFDEKEVRTLLFLVSFFFCVVGLLIVHKRERSKLSRHIEFLKEKIKNNTKTLEERATVAREMSEAEIMDLSSGAFRSFNYANTLLNSWQNLLLLHAPDIIRESGELQFKAWKELHLDNFPHMPEYLESISQMLTLLFGHKYSLCIKLAVPVNGYNVKKGNIDEMLSNLKTVTFSRCISSEPRNIIDDMLIDEGGSPSLEDNSDFKSIIKSPRPLIDSEFCCNNLPARKKQNDYLNTSADLYKKNEKVFRELGIEFDEEWPLPYKSALIVPICPADSTNKKRLSGFLCADSNELDAFKHDLPLMILRSAADNLFGVLSLLDKLEEEPKLID